MNSPIVDPFSRALRPFGRILGAFCGTIVLFTVGCGASTAIRPSESTVPTTTMNSGETGSSISDLLGASISSYEVRLDDDDGGQSLVWRQGQGLRRLDFFTNDSASRSGNFFIERLSDEGSVFGTTDLEAIGCVWWTVSESQGHVSCSNDALVGEFEQRLDSSMHATVHTKGPDTETILGRSSQCYSVRLANFGEGRMCVDDELGAPLLLEFKDSDTGEALISLHASSFKDVVANLDVPIIPNQDTSLSGLHVYSFEGTVPLVMLELPGR